MDGYPIPHTPLFSTAGALLVVKVYGVSIHTLHSCFFCVFAYLRICVLHTVQCAPHTYTVNILVDSYLLICCSKYIQAHLQVIQMVEMIVTAVQRCSNAVNFSSPPMSIANSRQCQRLHFVALLDRK